MTIRRIRRNPGAPVCLHCNNVLHGVRCGVPKGHGRSRHLEKHLLRPVGEEFLCTGGHNEANCKIVEEFKKFDEPNKSKSFYLLLEIEIDS